MNNVKLIVPRGTKAAYRKSYAWKKFNPIIEDVDHTITYNQPTNGTLKVKSDTQEITINTRVNSMLSAYVNLCKLRTTIVFTTDYYSIFYR